MKYQLLLLFGVVAGLLSCDRMNDLHDEYLQRGEKTYLSRVDSVEIQPGNYRAKVLFTNKDPKAETVTVYWYARTDSAVFSIPQNSVGQDMEFELTDLPEDFLTFELISRTSDRKYQSLVTEVSARIYGERYQNSLNNRLVDKAMYLESATELDITWKGIFEGAVNIEVEYDRTDGTKGQFELPIEERSILYLNLYQGNLRYRTSYVPVENAIDIFYTEYTDLHFSEVHVVEGLTFNINGTNQYMRIPNHTDFNIYAGEVLSISVWMKTSVTATNQRLVMKRYTSGETDNGNTGYGIAPLSSRRAYADWYYRQNTQPNPGGGTNVISGNNYFNLDEWVHYAVIFNSATKQIKLYQNGVSVGTGTLPAAVPANPNIVNVSDVYVAAWIEKPGGPVLPDVFKGEIAHLRFWKKELTVAEIQDDMISNVTSSVEGLVAAYDMRRVEGTGTDLTIPDIKGNHPAVLHGFSRP